MKKTGIFYGSATGTTEHVAREIAKAMGVSDSDIHDVAKTAPSAVAGYDVLILGSSTWGSGDLETDWFDFIAGLEVLSLEGKTVALFGCGDETMSHTFCDAVGTLYDRIQTTGASVIGAYPADCYRFEESKAVRGGRPVGLLIDDVNHPLLTPDRVAGWATQLKGELAD